ncbi:hypothetical protein N781_17140 [Pontibacillus halophilus JSM 076056 = DSM 19796]|uniref:Lipoprotein n=1 Tax=Pontibacillus halophilus JSM 076056 = DSM 19796 TaxID=1385510 RepID=A0A0A5GKQ0_9BACI|nr:hypothetical protein [Pontibacillus halophilus]KGX92524.1 hypothetical protein N781_17140 [Pontibacillus halophilus JSM 076056 = DSM 19796]
MKKRLWSAVLASTLALSACGSSDTNEDASNSEKKEDQQDVNVKAEVMDFQFSLTNTINDHDLPLYTYELAKLQEETPSEEELEQYKEEARMAASDVSNALEEVSVPDTLSEYEEELQAATNSLQDAYQAWGDNLSDEAGHAYEQYEASFKEAEEALGNVYVELGLTEPKLTKEVSDL